MSAKERGIKNIEIQAKMALSVISAYEFEFLKTEAEVQALLKPCTIYFIVQRPLLYFSKFFTRGGLIYFDIVDSAGNPPLRCCFDPVSNDFATDGEDIQLDIKFYRKNKATSEPFDKVAGFKILNADGDFRFWLTPQKFIHHVITGRLKADLNGSLENYINYHVHYIGKAFSQDIWDRLTGHEKMQAILTQEYPLDENAPMSSFEISLIMLDVIGFNEAVYYFNFELMLKKGIVPIVYEYDFSEGNDSFERFYKASIEPNAIELTNEVEAMLVNDFKPAYNEILFDNYPNIKSGTRSAGYTESTLVIDMMPVALSTDHFALSPVFPRLRADGEGHSARAGN